MSLQQRFINSIERWSNNELKDELSSLHLNKSGNKAELILRLQNYYRQHDPDLQPTQQPAIDNLPGAQSDNHNSPAAPQLGNDNLPPTSTSQSALLHQPTMNNQVLQGERVNSTSNIAATPVRQFNEREDNSSTASQILNNTHHNMPYNSGAQISSTTHTSAAMPSTYLEPAAHTQQYSGYPNHQYPNSYYNNEYQGPGEIHTTQMYRYIGQI